MFRVKLFWSKVASDGFGYVTFSGRAFGFGFCLGFGGW